MAQSDNTTACAFCASEIPEGAIYCPWCGRKQVRERRRRVRGNGQGTVVKRGNKWKAVVTLGYWLDDEGKLHRKTRSATFDRKGDAVAALPGLKARTDVPANITLKQLFDRWWPTHRAGDSTLECYRAAFAYLGPLWGVPVRQISVDDLQSCLDECGKGRRTKENARACLGLMYKYAIPRKMAELNLAPYLVIDREQARHREGFTPEQIEAIKKGVGTVPGADLIYCMIYTGFRPSEFLALTGDSYDPVRQTLTGGAKTEAGRGRVVTISPKIAHLIPHGAAGAPLWGFSGSLKQFTVKVFYPVLAACGVENPIIDGKHKYTPHSCRHTFATLMKSAPGADKDKLELIGHTSGEMLRYYQDVGLDDLRKITDAL